MHDNDRTSWVGSEEWERLGRRDTRLALCIMVAAVLLQIGIEAAAIALI